METVKSRVFNYLTKAQKSELCHFISKFVKHHYGKNYDEIMVLFLEDEKYYLEMDSSRHPWIVEYFDDRDFLNDLKLYIKENIRKYDFKESQKPYLEQQKEFQKTQRKIARDRKMQREAPTQRQLYYYKALCSKYRIDKDILDTEKASKLELKQAIDALLSEHQTSEKENILARLNLIVKAREEE